MDEPKRVSPEEARAGVLDGTTLLVCAYDDDELYKKMTLEGSIPLAEFRSRLPSLPRNQEIVFYCA